MLKEQQKLLLNKFKNFKKDENKEKCFNEIKEFIQKTNINFIDDKNGNTLLHYAVMSEDARLVDLLLDNIGGDNPFATYDPNDILNKCNKNGKKAIELAADSYWDFEIFKVLHKAGSNYQHKKLSEDLKKKIEKNGKNKEYKEYIKTLKKILKFIHNNTPKKIKDEKGNEISIYAYPAHLKSQAQDQELERQKKVTEKFFRIGKPLKKSKKSTRLYGEILTAIDMDWSVELDGYSGRAAVIAISKLLQKFEMFPSVDFKLGDTKLSCKPSQEKGRQIGNLIVTITNINSAPGYGDEIMEYLTLILGKKLERQKQLGRLLEKKSKVMKSFTLADINTNGYIKISDEEKYVSTEDNTQKTKEIKKAIHILNFILFMHVIGEVTRRLYRDKKGKVYAYQYSEPATSSDTFPVASFHARVIQLMKIGKIKLNDIYGNSGEEYDEQQKYGVVSGKDSIWNINNETQENAKFVNGKTQQSSKKIQINQVTAERKGECINELISSHYKEKWTPNYFKRHPDDYLQSSSWWLHEELRDQFGGNSESESEENNYSDQNDIEYFSEDENIRVP